MNPIPSDSGESRITTEANPSPGAPCSPSGPAVPPGHKAVSRLARWSAALGLLSLVGGFFLTGLPAILLGILGLRAVRRSKGQIDGGGLAITGVVTGLAGALFVAPLVLYFVPMQWDEVQSAANLRRIAASMRSCNEKTGSLPPVALCDKAGVPLLSWRVALLPYTGDPTDMALYAQFHLDEAWDGPHNIALLSQMPKMYAMPGDRSAPSGYTYYRVFVGNDAAWDLARPLRIPTDFPDGASQTILVAEAATAVPWTKPDELPYLPNGPLPPLYGRFPGGFQVATADGSVHFVSNKTTEEVIRKAIRRNDGVQISSDW